MAVLAASDPVEKIALTEAAADKWRAGALFDIGDAVPPDRPGRPDRPVLSPPAAMQKRGVGSVRGRVILLHAIAHIELNAVDLAWDLLARFAGPALPRAFVDGWISVASDEARHFSMLSARLRELGATYGDFPAHDGLWEAAMVTAHDLLARLAVVPLVLEARGLDVTPAMIERLRQARDEASADILATIFEEEIGHVGIGRRWFDFACAARGLEPAKTWRRLVGQYHPGALKPPFNVAARTKAGFPQHYYDPSGAASSS